MEKHELGTEHEETVHTTLGQILDVHSTPEEERKVLLKLDLILLPLMACAYFLQFLDKFILGQAALFNLREDLNLHGSEYSWTSAVFYFGYLAWSWPTSYLIVRLPIGKYLGTCVIIWGGVLMCHAACTNFGGLMAARFFLGVAESVLAPGFTLVTGIYYKRSEQPLRQSAWFFGNCVSALLGGLISYGIGHITSAGVTRWQLIFLILGAVTSGYGIILLVLLPDSPENALFLTKKERAIAVQRTRENKTGLLDFDSFQWSQARQAFLDPQIWLLVLSTFTSNLPNGGLTTFSAIITRGLGFSTFQSLLLQMSFGGVEIVFIIIGSVAATFIPSSRLLIMITNLIISLVGMALVWGLDADNVAGRMTGLTLSIVFAVNLPLNLSIVTSNIAGFSKRSVASGMIFVAYCVGNIVAPQFFFESQAPVYKSGLEGCMIGFALGAFFLSCLYVYYRVENKRRDRRYGRPEEQNTMQELEDELSSKTDREIQSFRYVV